MTQPEGKGGGDILPGGRQPELTRCLSIGLLPTIASKKLWPPCREHPPSVLSSPRRSWAWWSQGVPGHVQPCQGVPSSGVGF